MLEFIAAWLLLFVGVVTVDANFIIASGVFAVAFQIDELRRSQEKRNGEK